MHTHTTYDASVNKPGELFTLTAVINVKQVNKVLIFIPFNVLHLQNLQQWSTFPMIGSSLRIKDIEYKNQVAGILTWNEQYMLLIEYLPDGSHCARCFPICHVQYKTEHSSNELGKVIPKSCH